MARSNRRQRGNAARLDKDEAVAVGSTRESSFISRVTGDRRSLITRGCLHSDTNLFPEAHPGSFFTLQPRPPLSAVPRRAATLEPRATAINNTCQLLEHYPRHNTQSRCSPELLSRAPDEVAAESTASAPGSEPVGLLECRVSSSSRSRVQGKHRWMRLLTDFSPLLE